MKDLQSNLIDQQIIVGGSQKKLTVTPSLFQLNQRIELFLRRKSKDYDVSIDRSDYNFTDQNNRTMNQNSSLRNFKQSSESQSRPIVDSLKQVLALVTQYNLQGSFGGFDQRHKQHIIDQIVHTIGQSLAIMKEHIGTMQNKLQQVEKLQTTTTAPLQQPKPPSSSLDRIIITNQDTPPQQQKVVSSTAVVNFQTPQNTTKPQQVVGGQGFGAAAGHVSVSFGQNQTNGQQTDQKSSTERIELSLNLQTYNSEDNSELYVHLAEHFEKLNSRYQALIQGKAQTSRLLKAKLSQIGQKSQSTSPDMSLVNINIHNGAGEQLVGGLGGNPQNQANMLQLNELNRKNQQTPAAQQQKNSLFQSMKQKYATQRILQEIRNQQATIIDLLKKSLVSSKTLSNQNLQQAAALKPPPLTVNPNDFNQHHRSSLLTNQQMVTTSQPFSDQAAKEVSRLLNQSNLVVDGLKSSQRRSLSNQLSGEQSKNQRSTHGLVSQIPNQLRHRSMPIKTSKRPCFENYAYPLSKNGVADSTPPALDTISQEGGFGQTSSLNKAVQQNYQTTNLVEIQEEIQVLQNFYTELDRIKTALLLVQQKQQQFAAQNSQNGQRRRSSGNGVGVLTGAASLTNLHQIQQQSGMQTSYSPNNGAAQTASAQDFQFQNCLQLRQQAKILSMQQQEAQLRQNSANFEQLPANSLFPHSQTTNNANQGTMTKSNGQTSKNVTNNTVTNFHSFQMNNTSNTTQVSKKESQQFVKENQSQRNRGCGGHRQDTISFGLGTNPSHGSGGPYNNSSEQMERGCTGNIGSNTPSNSLNVYTTTQPSTDFNRVQQLIKSKPGSNFKLLPQKSKGTPPTRPTQPTILPHQPAAVAAKITIDSSEKIQESFEEKMQDVVNVGVQQTPEILQKGKQTMDKDQERLSIFKRFLSLTSGAPQISQNAPPALAIQKQDVPLARQPTPLATPPTKCNEQTLKPNEAAIAEAVGQTQLAGFDPMFSLDRLKNLRNLVAASLRQNINQANSSAVQNLTNTDFIQLRQLQTAGKVEPLFQQNRHMAPKFTQNTQKTSSNNELTGDFAQIVSTTPLLDHQYPNNANNSTHTNKNNFNNLGLLAAQNQTQDYYSQKHKMISDSVQNNAASLSLPSAASQSVSAFQNLQQQHFHAKF